MRTALLLIALGFGYKIFVEACKQDQKGLRSLGQSVGALMMILSLLASLYFITAGLNIPCMRKGNCPFMGKAKWAQNCPFMQKGSQRPAELPMPPRPSDQRY